MNQLGLLCLVAVLLRSHGVFGFAVTPPPFRVSPSSSSTELDLFFRKDGTVRSRFRQCRGFVRRRVFRQQPKTKCLEREIQMRTDAGSVVVNGLPLSIPPSIEEDIVVMEDPERNIRVIKEAVPEKSVVEGSLEEEHATVIEFAKDDSCQVEPTLNKESSEMVAEEQGEAASGSSEKENPDLCEAEKDCLSPPDLAEDDLMIVEEMDSEAIEGVSKEEEDEPGAVAAEETIHSSAHPDSQLTSKEEQPLLLEELSDEEKLIRDVDTFFAAGNPEPAIRMLQESDAVTSNGPLYWRLVKAHYELFSKTQDKTQQQDYLEKGLDLVETAPRAFDNDIRTLAFLLKWKAILLGKLEYFLSTKQKISNSFIIKESLETAQQLLQAVGEEDGSIYQALGEWCVKVAGISFLERQAASVLFGKPPEASYQEAVDYFRKAYQLKSTPALATKVSETYWKLGEKELALHWANKAVPPKNEILLP